MAWDDELLPEQKTAAAHTGKHARLLAGPGTGKTLTLTRRICYLVEEKKIPPDSILALTFTRAAAAELYQRVESELGADKMPRISTLHSFALRQLLRNSAVVGSLPKPLHIADDWEERHIIQEDLRDLLHLKDVREARKLLHKLSADWESLAADREDHLAWRMLITIRNNGIGDVGRKALYEFARSSGATYTKSLRAVADNSTKVAAHGNRLQQEYQTITKILDDLNLMPHNSPDEIVALVMKIASTYVADQIEATVIMAEIEQACRLAGAKTLISLLGALQATDDRIEQNLVKDKVNILTMHSAKGLTAEAVIVACAEDEYIPGKNDNSIEDERRLLYVSLTRAKHYLFMTYCNERTDQQRHSGRTAGSKARTPTRFLRNAPLTVQDGTTFIARM